MKYLKGSVISMLLVMCLIIFSIVTISCSSLSGENDVPISTETNDARTANSTPKEISTIQVEDQVDPTGDNVFVAPTPTPTIQATYNNSTDDNANDNLDTNTPTISSTPLVKYISFEIDPVEFSIQESKHTTPSDVLRELSYSGGFGGGGADCSEDPLDSPIINYFKKEDGFEWQENIDAISCGWDEGMNVQISLSLPDAEPLIEKNEIASSYGDVGLYYDIPLNTQPGEYELKFIGRSETVETLIKIIQSEEPRLYQIDNQLILFNFLPNENVRLLIYTGTNDYVFFRPALLDSSMFGYVELVAWEEYQVDEAGQLILNLLHLDQNEYYEYIVIGDQSGEVHLFPPTPFIKYKAISPYIVHTLRPNQNDINSIENIWNKIDYVDLKSPGSQFYETKVNAEDSRLWGFTWCASDDIQLEKIVIPLSLEFYINDVELFDGQILEYRFTAYNNWSCQGWKVILEEWPKGETVLLEISYNLGEEIFDGAESYPPGDYSQIINVTVSP